ncbi:hypothetical protein [Pedobacter punctiformis]|uniref:Uncharacterized protein n=1 Tax=Pedobacter punctiformis TaxID=3004097 RepID=A0ABT4L7J8_9SPHI|nr:hypothetical protein [Pedobacter sp. HCMS5-2]MCZ4243906.1 hypothetical protein [Pedobacter sp. HCMS5-2]
MLKSIVFSLLLLVFALHTNAQNLHLKKRKTDVPGGKAFAQSISDSTLTLEDREKIIFREIKNGNVPDFLRNLVEIKKNITIEGDTNIYHISYYVLPDYFAIGNNDDFIYMPMTPILAQKIADLTHCILPTKNLVDEIYANSKIKLTPQNIPPTKAMTTVPVFIAHTDSVLTQLKPVLNRHNHGELTAGNKKDIILSNKIYGESTPRVVIYGWHRAEGKPIQPVYNKHTNLWADYSHGIRLIQNKILINGKKTTLKKVLSNDKLNVLFSNEGTIKQAYYPVFDSY